VRIELGRACASSGEYLPDEYEPAGMQEQVVDLTIENG
jgi:hypothetical protein